MPNQDSDQCRQLRRRIGRLKELLAGTTSTEPLTNADAPQSNLTPDEQRASIRKELEDLEAEYERECSG